MVLHIPGYLKLQVHVNFLVITKFSLWFLFHNSFGFNNINSRLYLDKLTTQSIAKYIKLRLVLLN